MNTCLVPAPADDITGDGRWMSMHNRYVSEAKSAEPEVVLIGDSIISWMQFSSFWTEKMNSLHCLNFGIGGDKVQNVLWRLQNGELEFNSNVKALVLFVGTNNTDNTPEQVFQGITECVNVIKKKLGPVHIVIPTLLPRGQFENTLRGKNNKVNELLLNKWPKDLEDNTYIVPIHENIIQNDKTISHYIMYDYLHLTDAGYNKIFQPVYEKLCSIIQK